MVRDWENLKTGSREKARNKARNARTVKDPNEEEVERSIDVPK
jgi:hypothetical protein